MHAITAQYILDSQTDSLLSNKAILIENSRIIDILELTTLSNTIPIKDYGLGVICPGFIDLQLNGCGGACFNNDPSITTLETMYQTCLRFGTTGFLPTLITSEFSHVKHALEAVKEWVNLHGLNRGVLGIHLEGPFISKAKPGIHPIELIQKPTNEQLEAIVYYRQFFPIKMTIAVEEFTLEQIQFLTKSKIIVAIGHSNATAENACLSIHEGGVSAITHTFNAMSGLSARNPGVIGAALTTNVYTGVIVDLLHVDPVNIELLLKLKPNKTYLVTDAVMPMGTNIAQFKFAGKELFVQDGKCIDKNGTLGGANLTMLDALKNCIPVLGVDLVLALKMVTKTPAQVMGTSNFQGVLTIGSPATNLIHFNLDKFTSQIITLN
jgi:N-acetylglucosamine-6-phosphate deacetylase